MTEYSSLQERHSFEKETAGHTNPGSSHITDSKARSSLRNARSGNSLTSNLSEFGAASAAYSRRTSLSSACSTISPEERREKNSSDLSVTKRRSRNTAPAGTRLPDTPPNDEPGISTPNTSTWKTRPSFPNGRNTYQFATPPKQRAISYGAVVDTPPSSSDRYIPSRGRDDALISNFRANKPFFQLTPEEKQMRLDGAISDPFMARKVTPQYNIRRNASSGRHPQSRTMSAGGVWGIGRSVAHTGPVVGVHAGRGVVLGSGTNARMFSSDFFSRETVKETHERFEGRLAMALEIDRSGKVFDFSCKTRLRRGNSEPVQTTQWRDGQWASQSSKLSK